MLQQFLAGRMRGSLPVNGVLIPLNRVPESLQRFSVPALFYSYDKAWEITKKGTAFLLRFSGRYFAILAKHQLEEADPTAAVNPKEFSILVEAPDGRRRAINPDSASVISLADPRHRNLDDLLLLEYAAERMEGQFSQRFLDLDLGITRDELANDAVMASFAVGYPSYAGQWELSEIGRMTSANLPWVKVYLTDAPVEALDPENRRIMVQTEQAKQRTLPDPDGMSGAPTFSVWKDEHDHFGLVFVGLVTHARDRRFAIYPAGYIRDALIRAMQLPS